MEFNVSMPGKIYCGTNAIENLKNILCGKYKKVALFSDRIISSLGLLDRTIEIIKENGCEYTTFFDIPAEPSYLQVQEIISAFQESKAEVIIAVGGGSVMDTAKLASITDKSLTVKMLLEHPLAGKKTYPTIMVPTTAGTGSEATPNSIVLVPEKELKVGIVNPDMIADVVILDSVFIKNLPFKAAAASGVDALAHCIECYTSNKANAYSDLFALEGAKLIMKNIIEACKNPDAEAEKNRMLLGAFYGGVAIASSGTTAVHALSYPLGGKYHIPHGVSNAILLVPVMNYNKDCIASELAALYDALGENKETDNSQKADWVIDEMRRIVKELEIPELLTDFGVPESDLEQLVESGMQVTRLLNNNKKKVTAEDARAIYKTLF